jgi:hypothetical protein
MQLNHWNWKKVILIHGEKGSALTPAAIKIYDFSRNISLHFAAAASINNVALLDPTCTGNFAATANGRVKYTVD